MRRNHIRRNDRRDDLRHFDHDFAFRPDLPEVKYIIDYPRKTVFTNMEADMGARGVKTIGYGNAKRGA